MSTQVRQISQLFSKISGIAREFAEDIAVATGLKLAEMPTIQELLQKELQTTYARYETLSKNHTIAANIENAAYMRNLAENVQDYAMNVHSVYWGQNYKALERQANQIHLGIKESLSEAGLPRNHNVLIDNVDPELYQLGQKVLGKICVRPLPDLRWPWNNFNPG